MIKFNNMLAFELERFNDMISSGIESDIDEGTDADILETYAERFPRWTLLQEPRKCAMAFRELELMSSDYYEHTLDGLHSFILFRSIEDWLEFLETNKEEAISGNQDENDDDLAQIATLAAKEMGLQRFAKAAFPMPHVFLNAHELANAALSGDQSFRQRGIQIEDYLDILPSDIRARLANLQG